MVGTAPSLPQPRPLPDAKCHHLARPDRMSPAAPRGRDGPSPPSQLSTLRPAPVDPVGSPHLTRCPAQSPQTSLPTAIPQAWPMAPSPLCRLPNSTSVCRHPPTPSIRTTCAAWQPNQTCPRGTHPTQPCPSPKFLSSADSPTIHPGGPPPHPLSAGASAPTLPQGSISLPPLPSPGRARSTPIKALKPPPNRGHSLAASRAIHSPPRGREAAWCTSYSRHLPVKPLQGRSEPI